MAIWAVILLLMSWISPKCLTFNISFISGKERSHQGPDNVNKKGVLIHLFVYWLKTPLQIVLCELVQCRDARAVSCWGKVQVVYFTQPFQSFQIVNLVNCLSSMYKFIMKIPSPKRLATSLQQVQKLNCQTFY